MSIKQGSLRCIFRPHTNIRHLGVCLLLWALQISVAWATDINLQGVDVATLAGNKLQIQFQMDGAVEAPLVFKTDNPARISLDFTKVRNGLNKKIVDINAGVVSNLFVMETNDRTRVIVNLLKSVPYQTQVNGNQVLLTLEATQVIPSSQSMPVAAPIESKAIDYMRTLPKQGIANIDFKRGEKGEGRIIVALANPNTVVDTKEQGGKVLVNFTNTSLPDNLSKSLDVSDFATPVKMIDTQARGNNTSMTITPVNGNYEYSSFQSEGFLTLEFRPLTPEEKVAQEKAKFTYLGEKLSLNFQDIEIRSVLQILADFTKLNIVAADNVTGKITLQMNDVPWDQALDLILKSKGLSKRQSGGVIMVAPTTDINKMEEDELKATNVQQQLEPLKTEYIQVNYAKAENFRLLVTGRSTGSIDGCAVSKQEISAQGSSGAGGGSSGAGNSGMDQMNQGNSQNGQQDVYRLLSQRGSAVVDGRTNTLIVKDTNDKLLEIRKLVNLLDKPVRQVMIESRIVIATKDFAESLGVKFGTAKAADVGSGKTFGVGGKGTQGNIAGGLQVNDTLVDLGAAALAGFPPGALGMTLARGADYVLNLELQALQNVGDGEVLSNPRVLTSDRCKAVITQGEQIPYTVLSAASNGAAIANTQFKDALLELSVIPQITPNGNVIMNLNIKKDQRGTANSDGNVAINTRQVNTTVTVSDGETLVLGGVFEENKTEQGNSIPFFSDIPGIGFLFRNSLTSDQKKELLIFVTPKVKNEMVIK